MNIKCEIIDLGFSDDKKLTNQREKGGGSDLK